MRDTDAGSSTDNGEESRFWRWVRSGLDAKRWDMQTLAETAGIAQSTLTALRQNPARKPTPETCRKIARAFGVDETLALELAGHLHPGEVRAAIHGVTGQQLLSHTDPDTGETGTLPMPTRLLPVDEVELAKLAVQLIPSQRISEEDKWRVLSLIDALVQAQALSQHTAPSLPPAAPAPAPVEQPIQRDSPAAGGSTTPARTPHQKASH